MQTISSYLLCQVAMQEASRVSGQLEGPQAVSNRYMTRDANQPATSAAVLSSVPALTVWPAKLAAQVASAAALRWRLRQIVWKWIIMAGQALLRLKRLWLLEVGPRTGDGRQL